MNASKRKKEGTGSRKISDDVANATQNLDVTGTVANYAHASQIATQCLKLHDTKFWAIELNLHPRTVQRWRAGEAEIPKKWIPEIIVKAKGYFMDMSQIEGAVDRLMYGVYGKNDKGRF